jgi:hypothetical protein
MLNPVKKKRSGATDRTRSGQMDPTNKISSTGTGASDE